MAGIYLHIPYCKQACYYCNFHFSTTRTGERELLQAMVRELEMRKDEIDEEIETIYFGGGTPTVISNNELMKLLNAIYANYKVVDAPEITIEANPDDLTEERVRELAQLSFNRLSIGVQSFREEDLQLMNRAHSSHQAMNCLIEARKHFANISVDLIYGIPDLSMEEWDRAIQTLLDLEIPHISSYALTVEPKTALDYMVRHEQVDMPQEGLVAEQFFHLVKRLTEAGFVHYELSNFGKPGYFSRNNTAYWQGKKYLGIGPGAHSFDGENRSWNISNNKKYTHSVLWGNLPAEKELLSVSDRYNEYVMTGLRTCWGINLQHINLTFGADFLQYLLDEADVHLKKGNLIIEEEVMRISPQAKFLSDGIASDLFWVEND